MINNKSVLAIIPARGGSKGVFKKNIRQVGGKPLIAWSITEAMKSRYIDKLILSSEDEEIIKVAEVNGCEVPFVRPYELALDDTPGIDPVLHAMEMLPGYDYIVLLQPTSPLRTVEDIDQCIELCVSYSAQSCVSVTEPDKSPYWMYTIQKDGILEPLLSTPFVTRRQDLPHVYSLNGAVYAAESQWLAQNKTFLTEGTLAYVMPKERSLDIDTELDLKICDFLLNSKGRN